MDDTVLDRLASESEDVQLRRKKLETKLICLRESLKICQKNLIHIPRGTYFYPRSIYIALPSRILKLIRVSLLDQRSNQSRSGSNEDPEIRATLPNPSRPSLPNQNGTSLKANFNLASTSVLENTVKPQSLFNPMSTADEGSSLFPSAATPTSTSLNSSSTQRSASPVTQSKSRSGSGLFANPQAPATFQRSRSPFGGSASASSSWTNPFPIQQNATSLFSQNASSPFGQGVGTTDNTLGQSVGTTASLFAPSSSSAASNPFGDAARSKKNPWYVTPILPRFH